MLALFLSVSFFGENVYLVEAQDNDLALQNGFPNLSFQQPIDLTIPEDGTNRLFVGTKAGIIYVFANQRQVESASVFLDISAKVDDSGYEMGLLGVTFHPDYDNNGYFYVDYTAAEPRRTVVSRYTVSDDDPNVADSSSEVILLEIEQPYSNHNGGQIRFGPDGYLYIALGDGGSGGDPLGNGQNTSTLLGSILRIDVDDPEPGENYGIPDDNPFVGVEGADEIFAYGLRNPWRFSFDSINGTIWAADVGQSEVEEIDIIEKGGNYGWNIKEGDQCYEPPSGCSDEGLIDPIWTYTHDVGNSITGGYVYRGDNLTQLIGKYIYADFGSGRIWALEYDGVNPTNNTQLFDTNLNIASFGVDSQQSLYILAFDGNIYQIVESSSMPPDAIPADGPVDYLVLFVVIAAIAGLVVVGVYAWKKK
jgi:glucose/arabinose dehydrogenase